MARRPSGCLGGIALIFLIGAVAAFSMTAATVLFVFIIVCSIFVRSTRAR